MPEQKCEVCGSNKNIAGVCSSSLGPMSICICRICVGMRAEPLFLVETTIKCVSGLKNVHPDVNLTYFDRENDCYKNYRTKEVIPIRTKENLEFKTKQAFIDHYNAYSN